MACIEQLVFELGGDGSTPKLQARSAGVSRELAAEVAHICAGWRVGPDDLRLRPALVSLTLRNGLPGSPGRLYAAGRAMGDGTPRAFCHVLVLTEGDYASFGLNPYRVEKEKLFLDRWDPRLGLEQLERKPSSLDSMVAPLPGPQDAELVAEALRAYLADGRAVVPLVRAEEASDRFFALLLESLPLYAKRNVCFASFAPSGQAGFNVAATRAPEGSFHGWRRTLAQRGSGRLAPQLEEYVERVRSHLAAGDMLGLGAVSRALDGAPPRVGPTAAAPRGQPLTAAVMTAADPAPDALPWQRTRFSVAAIRGRVARSAPATPDKKTLPHGRLAIVLLVAASLVGLALFASPRHRSGDGAPAPAVAAAGVSVPGPLPAPTVSTAAPSQTPAPPASLSGIDTGPLYASELEAFRHDLPAAASLTDRQRRGEQAISALNERAAGELRRQCLAFRTAAAQDIAEPDRPDREAARAQSLVEKGPQLTSELRRLVLGAAGFANGAPWGDLGRLAAPRLKARWDSVSGLDPQLLQRSAARLGLSDLSAAVRAGEAVAVRRAKIARLLAQTRRDAGWLDLLALAAGPDESLPAAEAAWRDGAVALVALKRAEDAAGLGGLALASDYAGGGWLPATVQQAAAELRTQASRAPLPPLARATADLYAGLERVRSLTVAQAPAETLAAAVARLARNPAVAFDPDAYADHLERSRLVAVESLLARGRNAEAIPVALFPGQDRRSTLALLSLAKGQPDPAAWRGLARDLPIPFLRRWSEARAAAPPASVAPAASDRFDLDFQRLATASADLQGQAQRGQDWSGALAGLRGLLAEFTERYPARPDAPAARREKLARVEGLITALARPLPVRLDSVTVRLAPDQLRAPGEVQLQLETDPGAAPVRSDAIMLRPAADGSGWTASARLGWELSLRPGQAARVVVRRIADGRVIFTVTYGAVAQTMVPGALRRPLPGWPPADALAGAPGTSPGSVAFTVPDWIWRRLRLPDLRQPVDAAHAAAGDAT